MDKEKKIVELFEMLVKQAIYAKLQEFAESIEYKAENMNVEIDKNEPEILHVKLDLRLNPKNDKTATPNN